MKIMTVKQKNRLNKRLKIIVNEKRIKWKKKKMNKKKGKKEKPTCKIKRKMKISPN